MKLLNCSNISTSFPRAVELTNMTRMTELFDVYGPRGPIPLSSQLIEGYSIRKMPMLVSAACVPGMAPTVVAAVIHPLRPQLHFLLSSASNVSMVFISYADDVAGHHFGQGLISIRTVYHFKQVTVTFEIFDYINIKGWNSNLKFYTNENIRISWIAWMRRPTRLLLYLRPLLSPKKLSKDFNK